MDEIRPLIELADYREKHRLSREDLGRKLGVSAVTIWRWEAGERRPGRKFVSEVSKITGVPTDELMGVA